MAQDGADAPSTVSGWGLAQWTADRHVAIRDAVKEQLGDRFYVSAPDYSVIPEGMSQDDVDKMTLFQLKYISGELKGKEKTTTVDDATCVREEKYERTGVSALDERIAHARGYYKRFAGTAEPSTSRCTGASQNLASTCVDSGANSAGVADAHVSGEMTPIIKSAEKTLGNPYVFEGGDGDGPGTGGAAQDVGEVDDGVPMAALSRELGHGATWVHWLLSAHGVLPEPHPARSTTRRTRTVPPER